RKASGCADCASYAAFVCSAAGGKIRESVNRSCGGGAVDSHRAMHRLCWWIGYWVLIFNDFLSSDRAGAALQRTFEPARFLCYGATISRRSGCFCGPSGAAACADRLPDQKCKNNNVGP
ncbi:hypothetical protein O4J55_29215, partial [Paracoccus sp. PXZ]